GCAQLGGLEGPGGLWASLQEFSFLAVVCGEAAHYSKKRIVVITQGGMPAGGVGAAGPRRIPFFAPFGRQSRPNGAKRTVFEGAAPLQATPRSNYHKVRNPGLGKS